MKTTGVRMKTIVLLSGGLDSAVALASSEDVVEALTVDYGQRHRKEIGAAEKLAGHYNVPHTVASVDPVLFQGSALTTGGDLPNTAAHSPDSTYVPARNTVLIALAAARAEAIGAQRVVVGCNADDAGGYPDCRPRYLAAFRDVLNEGTLGHVWVHAPLLYCTKARVMEMAEELNVPVGLTWSCYAGGNEPCGQCGACIGRGDARVSS